MQIVPKVRANIASAVDFYILLFNDYSKYLFKDYLSIV